MKNRMGKRIKDLRKSSGMTQSELALKLGVSSSAVGMYEQCRREPDSNTILKLSSIFDVSVDYLLGNTEPDTGKDNVEVTKVFDELTKKLSVQEGLMFDGVPLDQEDRMKIIDAIKVVAAIARQQLKGAAEKN